MKKALKKQAAFVMLSAALAQDMQQHLRWEAGRMKMADGSFTDLTIRHIPAG